MVKVVFVQCNLVDNQYQTRPKVLYTFTSNQFCAYLLNVEPSNFVFLKICNTKLDEIIMRFKDQDGRLLEIKGKGNFTLLINR